MYFYLFCTISPVEIFIKPFRIWVCVCVYVVRNKNRNIVLSRTRWIGEPMNYCNCFNWWNDFEHFKPSEYFLLARSKMKKKKLIQKYRESKSKREFTDVQLRNLNVHFRQSGTTTMSSSWHRWKKVWRRWQKFKTQHKVK